MQVRINFSPESRPPSAAGGARYRELDQVDSADDDEDNRRKQPQQQRRNKTKGGGGGVSFSSAAAARKRGEHSQRQSG